MAAQLTPCACKGGLGSNSTAGIARRGERGHLPSGYRQSDPLEETERAHRRATPVDPTGDDRKPPHRGRDDRAVGLEAVAEVAPCPARHSADRFPPERGTTPTGQDGCGRSGYVPPALQPVLPDRHADHATADRCLGGRGASRSAAPDQRSPRPQVETQHAGQPALGAYPPPVQRGGSLQPWNHCPDGPS